MKTKTQATQDTSISVWREFVRMTTKTKGMPEYKDKCICGVGIKENCYITDGSRVLTVGSCCISNFLPKEVQNRTCNICRQPHQNRKNNFCNLCRETRCFTCYRTKESKAKEICNSCDAKITHHPCVDCKKPCLRKFRRCYSCNTEHRYKQSLPIEMGMV